MKKLKTVLVILAMGFLTFSIQSCNNSSSEDQNSETTISEEATYACPMHPEITGKEGDACSLCGMDLTPIEGEDHSGHNH